MVVAVGVLVLVVMLLVVVVVVVVVGVFVETELTLWPVISFMALTVELTIPQAPSHGTAALIIPNHGAA